MATIQDLQRLYKGELDIVDEEEEDRLEKIKMHVSIQEMLLEHLLIVLQSQSKRERCTEEETDSRRYGWTVIFWVRINDATESKKLKGAKKR